MKKLLLSLALATLVTTPAWAVTVVNYNTTGSTLSCNGVAGCAQNTSNSVTLSSGLTLTYNVGSGSGVVTPSVINLGSIVATGTFANLSVAGLRLSLNVNATPPGASGTLPNGSFSGSISSSASGATITFSPSNITTSFGTLPGVTISGGGNAVTFQVLSATLSLQAPTVGNPPGQTAILGAVTAIPEGETSLLMGAGLATLAVLRRRRAGSARR